MGGWASPVTAPVSAALKSSIAAPNPPARPNHTHPNTHTHRALIDRVTADLLIEKSVCVCEEL